MLLLFDAHSYLRYAVLVLGLAVAIHAAYGLLAKRPYSKTMDQVAMAFAGTLHLQLLLGIALLFTGRFQPALMGHIVMMLLAAGTAQTIFSVMRRRPEEERTYLPYLFGSVITLLLIVLGITAIGRSIL